MFSFNKIREWLDCLPEEEKTPITMSVSERRELRKKIPGQMSCN
jgi:hypothetical protein